MALQTGPDEVVSLRRSLDDPRVLVIDDDHELCGRIASDLSRRGYQTETACSIKEATAKVGEQSFDLAVIDLRMPGMGGGEGIGHLRQLAPEMRFLVATGSSAIEAKIECMKAGVGDYICKPFATADLVAMIETALGR